MYLWSRLTRFDTVQPGLNQTTDPLDQLEVLCREVGRSDAKLASRMKLDELLVRLLERDESFKDHLAG